MRGFLLLTGVVAGAFLWSSVWAQQEMLPKPGPGSGITKVIGTVNIGNVPEVRATQDGDWQVTVASIPFLKAKGRFVVNWPDGSTERLIVLESGPGSWVLAEGAPRRWVNLGMARSVEEGR